jgi:heterodisulfide reductase subunit C/nitrate reductase gamma subunit
MPKATLVYIALLIGLAGTFYKASTWFRYSLGSKKFSPQDRFAAAVTGIWQTILSRRFGTILKSFFLDVILQAKLKRVAPLRWFAHFLIFGGFTLLLLMHALGTYVNPLFFSTYYSTINPFLFLRNLFGALVVLGLLLQIYNRFLHRDPANPPTSAMDVYTILIFVLIMVSGIFLESVKITSVSAFRDMTEEYAAGEEEATLKALEAYWVQNYGVVSPELAGPFSPEMLAAGKTAHNVNCAQCHAPAQWAFMDYGVAKVIAPVAPLFDGAATRAWLYWIHFLVCLAGLAYLPFSKVFHLITAPICLMANSVMDRAQSEPANIATKQILELDSCTHCGACTRNCTMAFINHIVPNQMTLPSERISSLKLLASGKPLTVRDSLVIQEGYNQCTNCTQCTLVCPVGINLQDLWFSARETLADRDLPNLLVLSPISIHRGLRKNEIEVPDYAKPVSNARKAIADEFGSFHWPGAAYSPQEEKMLDTAGLNLRQNAGAACFSCMTCTNACPVVKTHQNPGVALDLLPHQIMQAVKLRLWDLIFGSKMLYECLGCYQCQEYCPMKVPTADLIFALRNVAVSRTSRNISQKALETL